MAAGELEGHRKRGQSGRGDAPGEGGKVVKVHAVYLELHVSFVRDRLKWAGIRLANLLSTALDQRSGGRRGPERHHTTLAGFQRGA